MLVSMSQHTGTYEETLEDALIDLYLSVKIRSNEEVSQLKPMTNFRSTTTTRQC